MTQAIALQRTDCIASIILDEYSFRKRSADAERERATAITDLLAANQFRPVTMNEGPYHVSLALSDNRLLFLINNESKARSEVSLPVLPFKRIIKDYFLMYESYQQAIGSDEPHRIEAIDMGRRGIHNEGSELLQELLENKIVLDFDTARRLFTLICVLHVK